MAETTDAQAIIDSTQELTLASTIPELIDEEMAPFVYGLTVPRSAQHVQIDLEQYAPHPRRKRANPTFTTTESLAAYVAAHATPGTTLYANPDSQQVVAILDDHSTPDPGHRSHKATLQLIATPGCKRWVDSHAKYLSQVDFAQLVEDGLTEIASPAGAELLEVAQSISATRNASFRSDRRLANGRVQFQWHEDFDAQAGENGDLTIPEIVTLVFEPFYGAEAIQVDARFRYRLFQGKLTLGFWLIRHEEQLREAFATELGRLEELLASALDGTKLLSTGGGYERDARTEPFRVLFGAP